MGVSLQVHRVRIGTFYPSVRVKTGKEQSSTKKNQMNWNYGLCLFALLLSCCTLAISNLSQYPLSQGFLGPTNFQGSLDISTAAAPHVDSYSCLNSDLCLTPSSWITARERNAYMKAMHGNRANRGRGIKIIAWNKGNSFLQNKHQEIEALIAADRPHILGLSEANLKMGADISAVHSTHSSYSAESFTWNITNGCLHTLLFSCEKKT